uniref:Uncharacterized protein n=1 Tax=Plectus sambesii TaxID=2011161 RepID=A0A914XVM9_9BILA
MGECHARECKNATGGGQQSNERVRVSSASIHQRPRADEKLSLIDLVIKQAHAAHAHKAASAKPGRGERQVVAFVRRAATEPPTWPSIASVAASARTRRRPASASAAIKGARHSFTMTKFKLNTKEKLSPQGAANKPTTLVDAVTAPPKGFGIRSYIHQFYQSPTVEDIESAGAWYLLPPPPVTRTGLYICRILTVIGL